LRGLDSYLRHFLLLYLFLRGCSGGDLDLRRLLFLNLCLHRWGNHLRLELLRRLFLLFFLGRLNLSRRLWLSRSLHWLFLFRRLKFLNLGRLRL
jgi:hypothetical protein